MAATTQETCTGPKTHKIIIAQRGNWVVRPGRLNVRQGDIVIWKAIGTNVHIFFPNTDLFGRESEKRVLDLTDGESKELAVRADAPDKVYPYSIFCDKPNTFAQGGSDPELIVDF